MSTGVFFVTHTLINDILVCVCVCVFHRDYRRRFLAFVNFLQRNLHLVYKIAPTSGLKRAPQPFLKMSAK